MIGRKMKTKVTSEKEPRGPTIRGDRDDRRYPVNGSREAVPADDDSFARPTKDMSESRLPPSMRISTTYESVYAGFPATPCRSRRFLKKFSGGGASALSIRATRLCRRGQFSFEPAGNGVSALPRKRGGGIFHLISDKNDAVARLGEVLTNRRFIRAFISSYMIWAGDSPVAGFQSVDWPPGGFVVF